MRRNPVGEGGELAQPVELRPTELLNGFPTVGAADDPAHDQQEDFRKRVELVALDAEVWNRGKMLKNAGRHEKLLRLFLE